MPETNPTVNLLWSTTLLMTMKNLNSMLTLKLSNIGTKIGWETLLESPGAAGMALVTYIAG